jgi:SAM-dependent methyltransferase
MDYKQHTACRVCGSTNLQPYLDLGLMPLANNLHAREDDARAAPRYPLQVLFCGSCSLSQLSVVISPERLFSHYVYRSSINGGYVKHCRQMAKELQDRYGLDRESFMIDIAGNDGALLAEFRDEIGLQVLNIDPAENLAAINEAQRIRMLVRFWSAETARQLGGFGKADLITATNVFAHVDDVRDFLEGARLALKDTGVLVLEFPYLADFIKNREFDTVYFEHLSYFGITPLAVLAAQVGLELIEVEHFAIHGGTVRVHLAPLGTRLKHATVQAYLEQEALQGFNRFEMYATYAVACQETATELKLGISQLFDGRTKIAAFAASAKGNTLLNFAGVGYPIEYIVDETPEKIGKWTPGIARPIIGLADFIRLQPDYLLLLSWNFATEIMNKCRTAGYRGSFIIPIPSFKVISPQPRLAATP